MTSDEREVVKAGAEAALRPFSNLIEKLFGGAAEQIGGMWEDSLRVKRAERQALRLAKLFKRVQDAIDEANFDPQPVPDKISSPILQSASVEDDEFLQERWANVL